MDVTPIITRLQAQLTGFAAIAGSASVDQAIETAPNTPAAYVVPLAETAEPSPLIGVLVQRLTQEFCVVLVIANLRDATGAAAAVDLAAKRQALRAVLLGWVPDAATGEAVEFVGGALLDFREARLWWRDVFRVVTYYRSA
jgi:hypothetical protein